MATLLDGRSVSDSLLTEVKQEIDALKSKGIAPKLVVIVVGENPASQVYVRKKQEACEKVGILSERVSLPESVTQAELLAKIEELNKDASVSGMIVQLPLPAHIEEPLVIKAINPYKDVDGFHAYNIGKMFLNKDFEDMAPCTPKGVIKLLDFYKIDVSGMDAVVIGKSNIVGKPMSVMLLNRGATVTTCHSRTKNLLKYTADADLIVVAVGKAGFLKAEMVKEGAVVVDVGINRLESGKIVGDADFEGLEGKVAAITPVPGGIGPMTVACLLQNTVTAAKKQANL
ncbi:bifunctional methylenetetrahydrofolate dehydrogenase/methenyltetrahydrofolate cyclohydrolase [Candidatus Peregrinibacteria bacterium RIFCSPLOWO2_01_FULL_48_20]|nr:MAG: bifunctional methylenetetrahydrofolate dehydrogenase/methenyltetrahydrofolate cyclohydrolase [Candidatus Peregrinibacteria bacterium RIFCSPLOWO2_01_FULL_48_20]